MTTSSEDGNCNEALHSSIKPQPDHTSDSREGHTPLKVCLPITSQLWLFAAFDFMVVYRCTYDNEFPWIY